MSTSRNYLSLRRTASVIALAASALWVAAPAQAQSARIPAPAALAGKGVINYCATIDNPPRAYFDEKQQPIGFEVELGTEIASRMGLKVNWVQLKFPGLVPALQAQQCDAIMQELFIRAERLGYKSGRQVFDALVVDAIDFAAARWAEQCLQACARHQLNIMEKPVVGFAVAVYQGLGPLRADVLVKRAAVAHVN